MRPIAYPLINSIILALTLAVNYLASTGRLGIFSVGELSARYPSLITPADYAFSIWGFIYLWLLAFVGFQWYVWKTGFHAELLSQTGIWFTLANIFNMAWLLVWTNGQLGLSVVLMFALLGALVVLVYRLRMEVWDAPLRIIAFVWWPISWYLGWIILASVTNVATWLVAIEWDAGLFPPQDWALLMIAVASLVYLWLTFSRNLREASLVGVWGFSALAVRHWENIPQLSYAALAASLVLAAAAAYHGYRNRETAPIEKWRRGEV